MNIMDSLRLLCICIFIVTCVHSEDSKKEIYNTNGRTDFVKLINNKIPLDLPDPITIHSFSQRFNDMILTGTFSGGNLTFSGLSTISLNVIEFDGMFPLKANVSLTVEKLNLYLDYSTDLMLGQLLPFYGTGNISANINKIEVSLYAEVSVLDLTHPKNIDVSFSIGNNTYLVIEGILRNKDISDRVNYIINTFLSRLVDFIDINKDTMERVLSSVIQSIFDSL